MKTLDERVMEYLLNVHPNDRSRNKLARINRRFGRGNTDRALDRCRKALRLMDIKKKIEPAPTGRPKQNHFRTLGKSYAQALNLAIQKDAIDAIYGKKEITLCVVDDLVPKDDTIDAMSQALLYGKVLSQIPLQPKTAYGGADVAAILPVMKDKTDEPDTD
jgi:hypothetical protein